MGHVANMTRMFNAFKDGPIELAGHKVDIRKVKLGLTDEEFDQSTALNYNYKDDKIIFLVHKDGATIQLECIAMPREMYLLKCESHKIYDFTRVFGPKNIMERGLETESVQSIYEKIKSNMIKARWQFAADKLLRKKTLEGNVQNLLQLKNLLSGKRHPLHD